MEFYVPKATMAHKSLPSKLETGLVCLGEDFKTARLRRGITRAAMAERMFVGPETVDRLESGEPGVSIGVLAAGLFILGMQNRLLNLLNPDEDQDGIREALSRSPSGKAVNTPSMPKPSMDF
jgi:transcriptional regulator with XRE-family HTH domain